MDEPTPDEPLVPNVDPAVVETIHAELQALRARHGRLTMPVLSAYPQLVQICGEGDLLEAHMAFQREMARYINGSKYEAAAALSIMSEADTVLDRLTLAAERFDYQDQRTMRRWSDRGLRTIAGDLVAIAAARGRLGRELLTLTLSSGTRSQLLLRIEQMDFAQLHGDPPKVTVWTWLDDDNAEEAILDLRDYASRSASDGIYRDTVHFLALPELGRLLADSDRRRRTAKILTVAIQGRSAPARTVTWRDEARLPDGIVAEVMTHRTMVLLTLEKKPEL